MTDEDIKSMSTAIETYLIQNNIPIAKPKDLMGYLIQKKFFKADHRQGLPLRKILRELHKQNKLKLIPQAYYTQPKKNKFWFFSAITKQ